MRTEEPRETESFGASGTKETEKNEKSPLGEMIEGIMDLWRESKAKTGLQSIFKKFEYHYFCRDTEEERERKLREEAAATTLGRAKERES